MVVAEALGKILCDHPAQSHEFSCETLGKGSIHHPHASHLVQGLELVGADVPQQGIHILLHTSREWSIQQASSEVQ